MSSILEALKKLEAEKAAKQAQERANTSGGTLYDPDRMVEESRRAAKPHRISLPVVLLLAGVAIVVVAVTSVAVTVNLLTSNPTVAAQTAQLAVPPQLPAPLTVEAAAEPEPEPDPAAEPQPAPAPAPAPAPPQSQQPAPQQPAASIAPEPETSPPAPESPKLERPQTQIPAPTLAPPAPATPPAAEPPPPAPVAEEEEPAPPPREVAAPPMTLAAAAPSPIPAARERVPAPVRQDEPLPRKPFKPEVISVRDLPPLRQSDRQKYDLENIKVNMLRGISDTRPYGQAIINLDKVMIGEEVPGTDAMLIAIDEQVGIGVEILSTGERFSILLR